MEEFFATDFRVGIMIIVILTAKLVEGPLFFIEDRQACTTSTNQSWGIVGPTRTPHWGSLDPSR